MIKGITYPKSRIHVEATMEGQSIEEMLRAAVSGKEPIKANAKLAYTERKDGVLAQYDIRTDRFELALQATSKVAASQAAARHFQDFPEQYQKNEDGTFKFDTNGNPILIGEC